MTYTVKCYEEDGTPIYAADYNTVKEAKKRIADEVKINTQMFILVFANGDYMFTAWDNRRPYADGRPRWNNKRI